MLRILCAAESVANGWQFETWTLQPNSFGFALAGQAFRICREFFLLGLIAVFRGVPWVRGAVEAFDINPSFYVLFIIIIGGLGSVLGHF